MAIFLGVENVISIKRCRVGREKSILANLKLPGAKFKKTLIEERTFILQKSTVYKSQSSEFVNKSRIWT